MLSCWAYVSSSTRTRFRTTQGTLIGKTHVHLTWLTVKYFIKSEKLKDTISKRIGLEQFENKLEYISQSESYNKASQKQATHFTGFDQLLYDCEFIRTFKLNESMCVFSFAKKRWVGLNPLISLKGAIIKSLTCKDNQTSSHKTFEEHNDIILQYKQIIRDQDMELTNFKNLSADYALKLQTLSQSYKDLESNFQFIKDQNALLKATSIHWICAARNSLQQSNNAISSHQRHAKTEFVHEWRWCRRN